MPSHSKRSHEGYLMVDHRAVHAPVCDMPAINGMRPLAGSMFESATITCSHCQRVVVLNPDRSRSRGYCPKCDHYVCDGCEAVRVASGGACRPFRQIVEQAQEAAIRAALGKNVSIFGPDGEPVHIAA